MIDKTYDENNGSEKYILNRKAGRSIIEHQPIFSPNGENLAIIVENIVRVYNIQTGDCVRVLEADSVIKELISIHFPYNEDYNLCGCSDGGLVITWTWECGAVLRETQLQLPNCWRILTFNLVDSNECFVTAADPASELIRMGSYSTKNGQLLYEFTKVNLKYTDIVRVAIGCCNGDKFAAIINGTKLLYIQNLYQPHVRLTLSNYNDFRILGVAAHHKDSTIAITDTFGRVTVIRGNLYDKNGVAREILHWHFLPAGAVCFSTQGNYIISGGMEKVLVKWTSSQLAMKAQEKTFIPRLPGMIRYITANNANIAITLTNNSIVIANAQMRVISTILECGGLSPVTRALGSSLVYHSALSALVMPGRTGHLQLFSTATDKVLYNIDITGMNTIPSERVNLLPLDTEVTCTAISADGSWLVTSEYRNDGVSYSEEKLKFWVGQAKSTSPFKLNTCVNLSHGGCKVVSIALNSKGEFCVSSGADQKFRIWKRQDNSHRNKIHWTCITACYYSSGISYFLSNPDLNNIKSDKSTFEIKSDKMPYLREVQKNDMINRIFNIHKESLVDDNTISRYTDVPDEYAMGDVAISQDGSLIAAWFGSKLTLWDTHLCNLRTSLSHPALRPKGIHVQFGQNDAAHYLVCTSENCVAVWSLLSLTLKWMVQIRTTSLVADPFSNKMAITTINNDVFVFSPHSSKPLLTQKCVLNPDGGVIKQCAFGSATGTDTRLYLMRNDSEIYCLEPERSEQGSLETLRRRTEPASRFSALIAEHAHSAVTPPVAGDPTAPADNAQAAAHLLSAAPHMMPPVSMLCSLFLQQLSGVQPPEEVAVDEDEEMQVDPQSSDDEDSSRRDVSHTPKAVQLWMPNYEVVKEKRLAKIAMEPLLDLTTTLELFQS